MIPKKAFYIWFGDKPKGDLVQKCILSMHRNLPDFEIIELNKNNFEVNRFEFTKRAYKEKKWAFVSDYARLVFLYENGGIYLDTDMYVLKSFDSFLDYQLVLGKEDDVHISAGMIACEKGNDYIKKVLDYYDTLAEGQYETIPRILTRIFDDYLKKNINLEKVKVFDPAYFYPFTSQEIHKFNFKNAPIETFAVHMWNYSWGNPVVVFLKKLKIHRFMVSLLDLIGIKNRLKKLLKII